MTLTDLATSGPAFDGYTAQSLAMVVGEDAASMIKAVATFEVTEVRPIVDMGQGWERSARPRPHRRLPLRRPRPARIAGSAGPPRPGCADAGPVGISMESEKEDRCLSR